MQRLCLFFLLILYALPLTAQYGSYEISARNASLGGTAATIADPYSAFHNIGGIGAFEGGTVAVAGYKRRYGTSLLSSFGLGTLMATQIGTFSLVANRFGTSDLYNEQRLGLGFGNQIGFVSLGGSVNYIQYSIETVGTKPLFSIDFGGRVEVSDQFVFGAYVRNLNQARIQSFTDERLPTLMVLGISYRPITVLMLNAEIQKDLDFPQQLSFGLEYHITSKVHFRTGFNTGAFHGTFGLGFAPGRLSFDYAFVTSGYLGDLHELSLSYQIKGDE